MPPVKPTQKNHSRWFQTTVGEFVEAVYDAAMEEYMDEIMARRIAMQMLLRKLRLEHRALGSSGAKKSSAKE
jgi:hypothetical protein